jgi:hypothetical protein
VAKRSQDLKLAAARYVLGNVATEELARFADTLLTEGVYSPAIGELGTTRGLVMAEAGPLFEQALRDLDVEVPSPEQAVWVLLRHHIGRIAYEEVSPREGLQSVREIYDRANLHGQFETYVGDSHGIEHLIAAYWEYDCLHARPVGESLETDVEAIRALDDTVVRAATVWVGEHGA